VKNRPNLKICDVEEGIMVQTKSMKNSFNEIISEYFPNLGKEICIQVQEAFQIPNR
jgi:hypothetical protein